MNKNYSNIIVSTLLKMLQTTPYDKISVATLCRESKVSRQSFYYYFADLDDCMLSIILLEVEKIRRNEEFATSRELLVFLYNYIYDNRNIFLNIANGKQKASLFEKIFTSVKANMKRNINKWIPESVYLPSDDIDYIISFYLSNFVSSLSLWMEKGFKTTPDYELVHFILVTDGMMKEWVKRFIAFHQRKALPDYGGYNKIFSNNKIINKDTSNNGN